MKLRKMIKYTMGTSDCVQDEYDNRRIDSLRLSCRTFVVSVDKRKVYRIPSRTVKTHNVGRKMFLLPYALHVIIS